MSWEFKFLPLQILLSALNICVKNCPAFFWTFVLSVSLRKSKKSALFSDWLDEYVKEHEKTFDKDNIRDFIDAFIAEKKKGEDDSFQQVQN